MNRRPVSAAGATIRSSFNKFRMSGLVPYPQGKRPVPEGRNSAGSSGKEFKMCGMLRLLGLNPPPYGGNAAENRQFANSAVRLIPKSQILWYDD